MPAVDSDKLIEALRRQQRHSNPTIELALERVIVAIKEATAEPSEPAMRYKVTNIDTMFEDRPQRSFSLPDGRREPYGTIAYK